MLRKSRMCVAAIGLVVLACGGGGQQGNSAPWAAGWRLEESPNIRLYDPPDSPRAKYAATFVENCEAMYGQLVNLMALTVPEKITIYRFVTSQDCEEATGYPVGHVEGYRIYTRIGAPIGGAIAIAAFTSIDPDAASFDLIRHGVRQAFDNQTMNVHSGAASFRAEGRWVTLAGLLTADAPADQEAYDYASASLVAYLIQRHGPEKFKMLWRSVLELGPSLEKIYGGTLDQIEEDWIAHMEREAKKT